MIANRRSVARHLPSLDRATPAFSTYESGINKARIRSRVRQNAGLELTAKARVLANAATIRCRFNFVSVP
jgi:hypothetical protein